MKTVTCCVCKSTKLEDVKLAKDSLASAKCSVCDTNQRVKRDRNGEFNVRFEAAQDVVSACDARRLSLSADR